MQILIPMAGRGQRFNRYPSPKPLIDVHGKPMILKVLENIGLSGNYIFLVLKDHLDLLKPILPGKIITVDTVTEGAACTCLLAKDLINNDMPLLIANCDQIMEWDSDRFMCYASGDMDGCILTYTSNSPKNSFAKVNRWGIVTRVAEKQVISDIATCGVYYWSRGSYMVDSCEKMIAKNIRCNNEFYLCPSYNEMIEDGLIVKVWHVDKHWPIGTPEDLEFYLENSQH